MAKVRAPLFSVAASGTIGKKLTYRQTAGGSICQTPPIPTGDPSAAQTEERQRFAVALNSWATLPTATKEQWQGAALTLGHQPVMLYTREYLLQRVQPPALPMIPASN